MKSLSLKHCGAGEARRAHNPEVLRSKRSSAMTKFFCVLQSFGIPEASNLFSRLPFCILLLVCSFFGRFYIKVSWFVGLTLWSICPLGICSNTNEAARRYCYFTNPLLRMILEQSICVVRNRFHFIISTIIYIKVYLKVQFHKDSLNSICGDGEGIVFLWLHEHSPNPHDQCTQLSLPPRHHLSCYPQKHPFQRLLPKGSVSPWWSVLRSKRPCISLLHNTISILHSIRTLFSFSQNWSFHTRSLNLFL